MLFRYFEAFFLGLMEKSRKLFKLTKHVRFSEANYFLNT